MSVAGGAAAQERPLNIGVVDLDFVASQSSAGKALKEKLDTFQQAAQAALAPLEEKASNIRQQGVDGVNSLSQERLAELQQSYEDAVREARRLRESKQREGEKMQAEGLQAIEAQLGPVFEKVRDEGGYDLILNNAPGIVVMAGERVEITQLVIDRLNAADGG